MRCIVIGGGLAGLMAAKKLRSTRPDAKITVIERNESVGGLLAGVDYNDQELYFDLGTHIFQETGDTEIDKILLNAVSTDDLIHFPVGEGDTAGAVFRGRLQTNTHYPDIRGGVVDANVVASLRGHIASAEHTLNPVERTASLLETASLRFGALFAEEIVGPTLARAYGHPADALAGFAMLLPGWTRVVVDDHADWEARVCDERYRSLVSVPNQRDLPAELRHARRSFYSRSRGSRAFVDGVANQLCDADVELLCGATILSLDSTRRSIEMIDGKGLSRSLSADLIILATGVIGAAQMLGVDLHRKGFDRPMPHWVVNVVLEQPCDSDLCYLYGLDSDCDWYRVTNYRAFSGNRVDRRLTFEVLGQHSVDSTYPQRLVNQLHRIGIIASSGIEFAESRKLGSGFPAPTVRNMRALTALGAELSASLPPTIILGGIGARKGLFFQNEIISDLCNRIAATS